MLILLIGGPVVLALPVVAVVAALRPRWLPVVSLVAMLAAGLIAATAAAPATLGGGAFGPAAQACALLALAAALYPASASTRWATDRSGWRPSRPLPGHGTRSSSPRATGRSARRPAVPPFAAAKGDGEGTGQRPAGTAGRDAPRGVTFGPPARAPFGIADELSCYYDAPAEPCNVHVELRVPGHLDEPRAGPSHRRGTGRAAPGAGPPGSGRLVAARTHWEVPPSPDLDPLSTTTWADEGELAQRRAQFLAAAPPLDFSPPVRLLLAAGPGEDCLILNAHHAALDGISCLELLRRIARHYPDGSAAQPAGVDRAAPAAPRPAAQQAPDAAVRGPAGRAARLLPRPAAQDRRRSEPRRSVTATGSADPCGRVPRMASGGPVPRATVNDVLITALVVAIGRWNALPRPAAGPDPDHDAGQLQAARPGRYGGQPVAAHHRFGAAPSGGGDLAGLVADVAAQTRPAKQQRRAAGRPGQPRAGRGVVPPGGEARGAAAGAAHGGAAALRHVPGLQPRRGRPAPVRRRDGDRYVVLDVRAHAARSFGRRGHGRRAAAPVPAVPACPVQRAVGGQVRRPVRDGPRESDEPGRRG